MKIKQVSYQRTINLGNYETVRLGAEAELSHDDNPQECYKKLKSWIDSECKVYKDYARNRLI